MDVLKRLAWAGLGMACLGGQWGCGSRDLSAPLFTTGPDSVAVVTTNPQKSSQDTARGPVRTILIETLSASDLRLSVGQTKPAPVTVLPSLATSPLYEMTSSKPGVAQVTTDGIRGSAEGSATITVHALDGSDKTTKFHVIVDAIVKACITLPCLCAAAATKQGDPGEGKDKGKDGDKVESGECPD